LIQQPNERAVTLEPVVQVRGIQLVATRRVVGKTFRHGRWRKTYSGQVPVNVVDGRLHGGLRHRHGVFAALHSHPHRFLGFCLDVKICHFLEDVAEAVQLADTFGEMAEGLQGRYEVAE
jgi:hypothetical protein